MSDVVTAAGPLTIEKILSPLSVSEFVNDYMGKRPVHLPGAVDDVKHLIDRQGVLDLCANPKADVFAGTTDPQGGFHQIQVQNSHARHMYATGWALQVEELHLLNPDFMELCHLIRDQLGVYSSMEAGVMLSQAGKGYPLHFDPNPDVWIFQVFGAKKWTYCPTPAIDRPLEYAILPRGDKKPLSSSKHYELDRPNPDELTEVMLEPGDVFYFPGGTWHAAEAREECCHVIIATVNSPWTELIFDALGDKLLPNAGWRQIPQCHETQTVPFDQVVAARLAELKTMVNNLQPADFEEALAAGRIMRRKGAYRQGE